MKVVIFSPQKGHIHPSFHWKVGWPALRTYLDMVKYLKFVLTGNRNPTFKFELLLPTGFKECCC